MKIKLTPEMRVALMHSECIDITEIVEPITADRDALAAQVGAQQELLKCWQTWLGASRRQCDESGKKLWDKIEMACSNSPKHLAEVRAKAVEQAVFACLSANEDSSAIRFIPSGYYLSENWLNQHAESIRKEGEE